MEQSRREKRVVELNDSFLATKERGLQPMVKEENQEGHISPKKKVSLEKMVKILTFRNLLNRESTRPVFVVK